LGEQRLVLENPVVVDSDRNEVELPLAGELENAVEQPDLGRPQRAVAGQAALGKDALRHPLPGDELQVAAQDGVVERIGKPTPHEEAAERPEEPVERKD